MTNPSAITTIFNFIKSCNRSKPHIEVLKHASRILEHLSAYPDLVACIAARKEGVDVLIDLIVNFRAETEVSEASSKALRMWCQHGEGVAEVCVFLPKISHLVAESNVLLQYISRHPDMIRRLNLVHTSESKRARIPLGQSSLGNRPRAEAFKNTQMKSSSLEMNLKNILNSVNAVS